MNIGLYEIVEFSKIYKRVMDLELRLKYRFFQVLSKIFKNKAFLKITPFLKQNLTGKYIKRKGRAKRDELSDLIASNKSDEAKLYQFVNMAYLSDIMTILKECKLIYKDTKFVNEFYCEKIDFNDLKRYASLLVKLRNNIMHFNVESYKQNKKDYLIALSFWEKQVMCTICFMHNLPKIKPGVRNILRLLNQHMPNFLYLDDRIICDMYDDLAFLNDTPIKKLASFWTIGREARRLRSELKKRITPPAPNL